MDIVVTGPSRSREMREYDWQTIVFHDFKLNSSVSFIPTWTMETNNLIAGQLPVALVRQFYRTNPAWPASVR